MTIKEFPITGKAQEKIPFFRLLHKDHEGNRSSLAPICPKSITNEELLSDLNFLWKIREVLPCSYEGILKSRKDKSEVDTRQLKKNLQYQRVDGINQIIDVKDLNFRCENCSNYPDVRFLSEDNKHYLYKVLFGQEAVIN